MLFNIHSLHVCCDHNSTKSLIFFLSLSQPADKAYKFHQLLHTLTRYNTRNSSLHNALVTQLQYVQCYTIKETQLSPNHDATHLCNMQWLG